MDATISITIMVIVMLCRHKSLFITASRHVIITTSAGIRSLVLSKSLVKLSLDLCNVDLIYYGVNSIILYKLRYYSINLYFFRNLPRAIAISCILVKYIFFRYILRYKNKINSTFSPNVNATHFFGSKNQLFFVLYAALRHKVFSIQQFNIMKLS